MRKFPLLGKCNSASFLRWNFRVAALARSRNVGGRSVPGPPVPNVKVSVEVSADDRVGVSAYGIFQRSLSLADAVATFADK